MPHDRNGTPLAKGDKVFIEAVITELQTGEEYCNVTLQTVSARKPDGQKETISANTAVLEKWEDDEADEEAPQAAPA